MAVRAWAVRTGAVRVSENTLLLGSSVNRGNLDGAEVIYAPNYVGHDRRDRTFWKPKVIYLGTTGFTRKRDRGELLVFIEDS